ncbi:conserved protein, unknown function, partial [Hepatocystis sp. ex Piliocolobus tephrosceles]
LPLYDSGILQYVCEDPILNPKLKGLELSYRLLIHDILFYVFFSYLTDLPFWAKPPIELIRIYNYESLYSFNDWESEHTERLVFHNIRNILYNFPDTINQIELLYPKNYYITIFPNIYFKNIIDFLKTENFKLIKIVIVLKGNNYIDEDMINYIKNNLENFKGITTENVKKDIQKRYNNTFTQNSYNTKYYNKGYNNIYNNTTSENKRDTKTILSALKKCYKDENKCVSSIGRVTGGTTPIEVKLKRQNRQNDENDENDQNKCNLKQKNKCPKKLKIYDNFDIVHNISNIEQGKLVKPSSEKSKDVNKLETYQTRFNYECSEWENITIDNIVSNTQNVTHKKTDNYNKPDIHDIINENIPINKLKKIEFFDRITTEDKYKNVNKIEKVNKFASFNMTDQAIRGEEIRCENTYENSAKIKNELIKSNNQHDDYHYDDSHDDDDDDPSVELKNSIDNIANICNTDTTLFNMYYQDSNIMQEKKKLPVIDVQKKECIKNNNINIKTNDINNSSNNSHSSSNNMDQFSESSYGENDESDDENVDGFFKTKKLKNTVYDNDNFTFTNFMNKIINYDTIINYINHDQQRQE